MMTFFLRSPFFGDWRCKKVASQSLSYGNFAKTSGHFHTFSGTYTKGEKLEETLYMSSSSIRSEMIDLSDSLTFSVIKSEITLKS